MKLIEGKKIADRIINGIKKEVESLPGRPPGLAFILVGNHPASQAYVSMKKRKCQEIGFLSKDFELKATTSHEELSSLILKLNCDPDIDGILLQMPLPDHLNSHYFLSLIDPKKDVDGFHPFNVGELLIGEKKGFISCTPYGIYQLLKAYQIPTEGKHVVIVGRSNIVGKPLAALLMQKEPHANATVTVAHSKTEKLEEICRSADILIAAMGKKRWITNSYVKKGAVVIDVGINREGNKLYGDVDFDSVAPLTSYITPVPGGVGPMTIAMLLINTLTSYLEKNKNFSCHHLQFKNNLLEGF